MQNTDKINSYQIKCAPLNFSNLKKLILIGCKDAGFSTAKILINSCPNVRNLYLRFKITPVNKYFDLITSDYLIGINSFLTKLDISLVVKS